MAFLQGAMNSVKVFNAETVSAGTTTFSTYIPLDHRSTGHGISGVVTSGGGTLNIGYEISGVAASPYNKFQSWPVTGTVIGATFATTLTIRPNNYIRFVVPETGGGSDAVLTMFFTQVK